MTLIKTSAEFVANYTPPDYLIEGVIRRKFLYSMTGPTGAGKTGLALLTCMHIDQGVPIQGHEVEKGKSLFLAGENVDDVQARWIALCDRWEVKPELVGVHFMPGVERLSDPKFQHQLVTEATQLGPYRSMWVDTSAAYSEVEDENDNVQMTEHAAVLRKFTTILPGCPTVIALCHPVKSPNPDNLLPRGGGAFLAAVDGNFACRKVSGSMVVDLHTHGKFRGVEFSPLSFELVTVTSDKLKDTKGRLIPTVIARSLSDEQRRDIGHNAGEDQNRLLFQLKHHPALQTLSEMANNLGWTYLDKDDKPQPYKSKVTRLLTTLKAAGLADKDRADRWVVTKKGEQELKSMDATL